MNWKKNEILVSAIYKARTVGAEVKWNERIDGRQFDVTVRFKKGLHNYLSVIECKAVKKKVPAETVEAFITKSKDVGANHAAMISTSGFQSGAIAVAKKHNIDLLRLKESWKEPKRSASDEPTKAASFHSFEILLSDGRSIKLEDDSKLEYQVENILITTGEQTQTIAELVEPFARYAPRLTPNEMPVSIQFPSGSTISGPDGLNGNPIKLSWMKQIIDAYISSNPVLDGQIQQSIARQYTLQDMDGNVVSEHSILGLNMGDVNEIEPGCFYLTPAIGNYFYCDSIDGGLIRWMCVESYQHGKLWQAVMTMKIENASEFVKVRDKKKISELEVLLEALREKDRKADKKMQKKQRHP